MKLQKDKKDMKMWERSAVNEYANNLKYYNAGT